MTGGFGKPPYKKNAICENQLKRSFAFICVYLWLKKAAGLETRPIQLFVCWPKSSPRTQRASARQDDSGGRHLWKSIYKYLLLLSVYICG